MHPSLPAPAPAAAAARRGPRTQPHRPHHLVTAAGTLSFVAGLTSGQADASHCGRAGHRLFGHFFYPADQTFHLPCWVYVCVLNEAWSWPEGATSVCARRCEHHVCALLGICQ